MTRKHAFWLIAFTICVPSSALAQGTPITYQGKLSDSGNVANGQYDFQFKLFDTATVGTGSQQGGTLTLSSVTVSAGIFTVQLDFGACPTCFNGAARYLEIAVKATSGSSFTTLDPRQPIASTPYAIKSIGATAADGLSVACINCVTSSQIGSVSGSVISGAIPVASVPPGSGSIFRTGRLRRPRATSTSAATSRTSSRSPETGRSLLAISSSLAPPASIQRTISLLVIPISCLPDS